MKRRSRSAARRVGFGLWLTAFVLTADTPVASGASNSPCNPWVPLQPGASWTWLETSASSDARIERTLTVESVESSADHVEALLVQKVRESGGTSRAQGKATTRALCRGGVVTLETRGSARARSGAATSEAQVIARLPGLPAPIDLAQGRTTRATTEITTLEGGRRERIRGERVTRSLGKEAVVVPAGRFAEAIHLVIDERLKGQDNATYRQRIEEWWARGTGLVLRVNHRNGKVIGRETLVRRVVPVPRP